MTTLMTIYTDGAKVGQCDARCYNATSPACSCICGGANHGVGLRKAAANTITHASEWLAAQKSDDPRTDHDCAITCAHLANLARQMLLTFTPEDLPNNAAD